MFLLFEGLLPYWIVILVNYHKRTLYNDQIFQLTYRKKVGFVYDLETFERIREFDLQTAEGWGLTTDNKNLIVSDGSSALYFYHPEYFNQVNQLDVCNNRSLVTSLNELEYINGSIYSCPFRLNP